LHVSDFAKLTPLIIGVFGIKCISLKTPSVNNFDLRSVYRVYLHFTPQLPRNVATHSLRPRVARTVYSYTCFENGISFSILPTVHHQ